jgi:hypothetical protein
MADVLREFLVGLSFKIDQSSQQRFTSGVSGAEANVGKLKGAVDRINTGVKDFGKQIGDIAERPQRLFGDAARKIGLGVSDITKGLAGMGRTAAITGGAFIAAISQVAQGYTELHNTAALIGTSVTDLTKFQKAAAATGIGAQEVTSALTNMSQRIRENPGIDALVQQWTHAPWEQLKDKAQDGLLPILKGLDGIYKNNKAYALQLAETIMPGLGQLLVKYDALGGATGEFQQQLERINKTYALSGVNHDKLAAASAKLTTTMGNVGDQFREIGNQAYATALPSVQSFFEALSGGLDRVLKYNKDHPGMGLVEAGALAVSGLQTVLPVLSQLGLKLTDLSPWMWGIAAVAGLIIANWDKLGPYFNKKFQEIKDAYDRGGITEAIKATGKVAHDVFFDIVDYVKAQLDKIDWRAIGQSILGAVNWAKNQIDAINWRQVGTDISNAIKNGLQTATDFTTWLRGLDWGKAGEWIGEKVGNAIKALLESSQQGEGLVQAVVNAFANIGTAAVDIGMRLADGIVRGLIQAFAGESGLKAYDAVNAALNRITGAQKAVAAAAPLAGVAAAAQEAAKPVAAGEPESALHKVAHADLGKIAKSVTDFIAPGGGESRAHMILRNLTGQAAAPAPTAQQGGIVPIGAHPGEMILPRDISAGFRRLFAGASAMGGGAADAATGMGRRAMDSLGNWLVGQGAVPKVEIANPEDIGQEGFFERMGRAAGGAVGGVVGGPEGAASGARIGGSVGRAVDTAAAEAVKSIKGAIVPDIIRAGEKHGATPAVIQGLMATAIGEGGLEETWKQSMARTKTGERERSFGPWQLYAGGELPAFLKAGGQAGDIESQTQYVLNTMEKRYPGFKKLTNPAHVTQLMHDVFRDYGAKVSNVPAAMAIYHRARTQMARQPAALDATLASAPKAAMPAMDATLGGAQLAAGGALAQPRNGAQVTMNVANHVHIQDDGGDKVGRYAGAHRRIQQDMQRDLQTAIA